MSVNIDFVAGRPPRFDLYTVTCTHIQYFYSNADSLPLGLFEKNVFLRQLLLQCYGETDFIKYRKVTTKPKGLMMHSSR